MQSNICERASIALRILCSRLKLRSRSKFLMLEETKLVKMINILEYRFCRSAVLQFYEFKWCCTFFIVLRTFSYFLHSDPFWYNFCTLLVGSSSVNNLANYGRNWVTRLNSNLIAFFWSLKFMIRADCHAKFTRSTTKRSIFEKLQDRISRFAILLSCVCVIWKYFFNDGTRLILIVSKYFISW